LVGHCPFGQYRTLFPDEQNGKGAGRHPSLNWGDGMRASEFYEPRDLDALCEALAGVLATLGVSDEDDVCVRAATRIVELANAGVRDPEKLKAETLRWLRH